jgi:hypothetical protein
VAEYAADVRIDRDRARIYGLAIIAGLIAEVGLVLVINQTDAKSLALLFFAEAVILGLVFGAKPGMVAAIAPWFVLYPTALVVDNVDQPVYVLSALVFVVIVQAFLAGMAGAMKDRYWTRSVPPPGA